MTNPNTNTSTELEVPPSFLYFEKLHTKQNALCPPPKKQTTLPVLEKLLAPRQVSTLQDSHKVMDRMRQLLAKCDRSDQQIQMHEKMLRCVAPQVYGAAIQEHEMEVMAYNRFENLTQEIIITAPRRFGKSWAVAMFACVALLCIKGCEISIFSSGARASGVHTGMSGIIRTMLADNFGVTKNMISAKNQEHTYLKLGPNDVRKLNAYPGSVHT